MGFEVGRLRLFAGSLLSCGEIFQILLVLKKSVLRRLVGGADTRSR